MLGGTKTHEERIASYKEGPAFHWPVDRDKILARMEANEDNDLLWCPMLFERPRRQMEFAMDEHCLWADLDESDPTLIDEYPPTTAWETSPGRYQCLWILKEGDLLGASWQARENQQMTQYVGADPSGWDTTQLLRVPGWRNHKVEYRTKWKDKGAPGKLLWHGRRWYKPTSFKNLPEVERADAWEEVLEGEVDAVNRLEVWSRVRLKISRAARELYDTRGETSKGDGRSDKLWIMERELADAGCTAAEIVALVRETAWNKYKGRHDELKRLTTEAGKALAERVKQGKGAKDQIRAEENLDHIKVTELFTLLKSIKPPVWLVKDVWTEGSCGFIAGQPKSYKSWIALDMALSVATGAPFLDRFQVPRPGPVLWIQEEDALPTVKGRVNKIWPSKRMDKMVWDPETRKVTWYPAVDVTDDPPVAALVRQGFVVSDGGWQAWLDDVLAKGLSTQTMGNTADDPSPYRMVILDPLMMIAGDVDENRAQDMTTKIFRPLKELSEKHGVAMVMVHHMRKGQEFAGTGRSNDYVRGGQMMLGSVANHAWAEDSLYVRLTRSGVEVERESKFAGLAKFKITGLHNQKDWNPQTSPLEELFGDEDTMPTPTTGGGGAKEKVTKRHGQVGRRGRRNQHRVPRALAEAGTPLTVKELAEKLDISLNGVYQQVGRAQAEGLIEKVSLGADKGKWTLTK